MSGMGRREFVALLSGAAAAWPIVARAQQSALPVIGFMHSASPGPFATYIAAFRDGLAQTGYVEGRNFIIEYRWAEGQTERLPELASELVRRPVAVLIAAGGSLSAVTAKRATSTIPIVFPGADDAVKLGLVDSLNRPGGNITGVSIFNAVLAAKRLELLRELASKPISTAFLVSSKHPSADAQIQDLEEAAQSVGQKVIILRASSAREIEEAFATLIRERIDALVVGADPFFQHSRDQLVDLAARHRVLAVYLNREFPVVGGLVSYGVDFPENYRHAGLYAGRILKGEKPADLPVIQPTKFELVINLKTAKALGVDVPPTLLARADEVIE
jgi:putative tryptophan/tyrosine transport system substrate-binding protein